MRKERHVHHHRVIRTRGSGSACGGGCPVRNRDLGDVEEKRVASDDCLASDLELAVLRVVEAVVDGAGHGSAGEEDSGMVSGWNVVREEWRTGFWGGRCWFLRMLDRDFGWM